MEENLRGKEKKCKLGFLKKKEIWISVIIGILIGASLIYLLTNRRNRDTIYFGYLCLLYYI